MALHPLLSHKGMKSMSYFTGVNSQSKSHIGNGDGVTMRNVVEISLGKLKKRQK